MPRVTYDPDALAFMTAAGLTDNTQKNALNSLVVNLKSNSLWTKMKAVYPFIGGSATAHKFNLLNPLDTNAAFRLNFIGGITHSSNGILGDGINGASETYFTPNVGYSSQNNLGISAYSTLNNNTGNFTAGVYNSSGSNPIYLQNNYPSSIYAASNSGGGTSYSDTNTLGFYTVSRLSSTTGKIYKNGAFVNNSNATSAPLADLTMAILAAKYIGGSPYINYSNRQLALFAIHDGLSDAEVAIFSTIVNNYQTALSRNVY